MSTEGTLWLEDDREEERDEARAVRA